MGSFYSQPQQSASSSPDGLNTSSAKNVRKSKRLMTKLRSRDDLIAQTTIDNDPVNSHGAQNLQEGEIQNSDHDFETADVGEFVNKREKSRVSCWFMFNSDDGHVLLF